MTYQNCDGDEVMRGRRRQRGAIEVPGRAVVVIVIDPARCRPMVMVFTKMPVLEGDIRVGGVVVMNVERW